MISSVQYEPITNHDIQQLSVMHVHHISSKIHPAANGSVHDLRMGAMRNLKCSTCLNTEDSCPGHFGYIQLKHRVFHPVMKTKCKDIITSTCFTCFSTINSCTCIDHTKRPCKRRKVDQDNNKNTTIVLKRIANKDKKSLLKYDYFIQQTKQTPEEIYQLLLKTKHSRSVVDSFFLDKLLVLPNTTRPPEMNSRTGNWSAHPTSLLYLAILRANKNGTYEELQNAVNMLFDVENTHAPIYSSAIAVGGLRQRLDGKNGRLRLNMMGKRTNFSARTVLSGDPTLGINEIAIPQKICDILTIPVHIHTFNIQKPFRNEDIKYVIKIDKKTKQPVRYDFALSKHQIRIEIGDIVERKLRNGDLVAVNRQPTLHRGSMMACRVRVSQLSTFGLNYTTMIPLNADTDGDEINIHVPQSVQATAELEELMLASMSIVCSQSSKPLMGCTQDSLLGLYLLSKNDAIPTHVFNDILYEAGMVDVDEAATKGIQFMTCIFKHLHIQDFTLHIPKSGFSCVRSVVMDGATFDKPVVGTADGSVIHAIYLSYGHQAAADFIHILQKVAIAYLDRYGASIGPGDCYVTDTNPPCHAELDHYVKQEKKLPNESELVDALNIITRRTDLLSETNNNLTNIIKAGSKGSMVNFNQITQSVGQQIINAGRPIQIDRNFPHFTKYDYGLYARGFIASSFISGMNPTEVFFHAMSGRVGIIDTGCKTADTGAQSRRLIKCTEDLLAMDQGMVVNRITGNIIQFEYGEGDRMDGTFLYKIVS